MICYTALSDWLNYVLSIRYVKTHFLTPVDIFKTINLKKKKYNSNLKCVKYVIPLKVLILLFKKNVLNNVQLHTMIFSVMSI